MISTEKQELLEGFQPIGNYFVLERDELPETTKSGLYIPKQAQSPVVNGTVTHIGTGQKNGLNGEGIPMFLKVGDRVVVHPSGIQQKTVNGVEFEICHEGDAIGYWRD